MMDFDYFQKLVNETTTGDAVAFVPSQLGAIQKAMVPLAKMRKKKWKLSVKNDPLKEKYTLSLDDNGIEVAHQHWGAFQKVMGKMGRISNDGQNHYFQFFSNLIAEAVGGEVEDLKKSLDSSFKVLLGGEPFSSTKNTLDWWSKIFGGKELRSRDIAISLLRVDEEVPRLVNEIQSRLSDDRGSYEILISSLEQRRSLKVIDPMGEYETLAGAVVRSPYAGVLLQFEAFVDMNMVPAQLIKVTGADEEMLDELDGFKGVKVSGDTIYPPGKYFSPNLFIRLKKEIDLMEEKNVTGNSGSKK